MYGGITFRQAIDNNKEAILKFLSNKGASFTSDIYHHYEGEKDKVAIRKALNELRRENKIATDNHVHMWQGKKWELV